MPIVNTKHDTHLGNFISCDIYDRNIDNTVCDFYQRSHGLINEFHACDCITLINLHKTYFMHMYGGSLWNLNIKKIEAFRIAWLKIKHQICHCQVHSRVSGQIPARHIHTTQKVIKYRKIKVYL